MKGPIRHLWASDNASGVHPEVMAKLAAANRGHALGYGADAVTEEALAQFREQFGEDAEVFMVFNGTAANVLALRGMLRPHQAVACGDQAHLWRDEAGAPEHALGCKLLPLPSAHGKLDLDALALLISEDADRVHRSQPRVLSIAQATERGTVYSLEELEGVRAFARKHRLLVHMDGARLCNAAVSLGVGLRAVAEAAGVDVLSFGGTKNGLMMAEAIVVLNPLLKDAYPWIRKQGMQLASKHRFLAAQFVAYFERDLWRRNAQTANQMAAYLGEGLQTVPGVSLVDPVEANLVFARVPRGFVEPLAKVTPLLTRPDEQGVVVRLVASFDTTRSDVDALVREFQRWSEGRMPD